MSRDQLVAREIEAVGGGRPCAAAAAPTSRRGPALVALAQADHLEDVGDLLAHRLRVDAVLLVVRELLLAPAHRLGDRVAHRVGHLVGVHDHLAVDVARGAADRLDQRRRRPQEAFLVGVEDRDERHLGQVEPFAQQVDADEHVELAEPQRPQDLDALERVDLGVQVAHADAELEQVVGEVLGHLLRERGDEHALIDLGAAADLGDEVVDLALRRLDDDLGIDEAGRPHDLLDDLRRDLALVRPGRRRHEHDLVHALRRTPRTATAGCPSRTAAGSRGRRACPCATGRLRTGRAAAGSPGATRRARTASRRGSSRAACTAAGGAAGRRGASSSSRPPSSSRPRAASRGRRWCACAAAALRAACRCPRAPSSRSIELGLDAFDRLLQPLLVGDVVRRGEQRHRLQLLDDLARERIDRRDALDLVAEERDAHRPLLVRGEDLDRVAAHPELVAGERQSLRSYCSSTSRRRIERWSRSSPTSSIRSCFAYISGEPRP